MKPEINVDELPKRRLYQIYFSQRTMRKIKLMQPSFFYSTYQYELVQIIVNHTQ